MEQISITDVLLEIRQYRVGLIQTPDQLRFTYLAILEGVKVLMPEIYQKATENHSKANEGRLSVSDNLTIRLTQKAKQCWPCYMVYCMYSMLEDTATWNLLLFSSFEIK